MAKDFSDDPAHQGCDEPVDSGDFPSTQGANATKADRPRAEAGDATKAVQKDATPWPATASGTPERSPQLHWPSIDGYEIVDELGRGGMGVVYKAQQLNLNRAVALKMVLAGPYASPAAISRFMGEAWSAARLQHPNIVQVYDLGEWKGQPYFAMEFVDGGHLARRAARKPFSFREAAEMIETLARAVHYAHQSGVVHRDLKPGNVLLTRDGVPKIADFGLAKRLNTEDGPTHAVTATGAVLGTPGYLSPEQAAGKTKEVGPPADVYALGVMLYELITGRRPFDDESELSILQRVINEDPAAPSRLKSSVPRDVETICLKCLEKDPRRRYAAAGELADDLRRYLNGEPILARRIPMIEAIGRSIKRRPLRAVLTGLLLVALGLAGMRTWNYFAY
jgi:serine/threonine-protein kinase